MDITLNGDKLTIEEIMAIGSDGVNIKLSNDSINRMRGIQGSCCSNSR